MNVLQFAFGGDDTNPFLPKHHVRNSVVYTGTHDNDTTRGWLAAMDPAQYGQVAEYFGLNGKASAWPLIRAAYAALPATKDRQEWLSNALLDSLRADGLLADNFRPIAEEELERVLDAALVDEERGVSSLKVELSPEARRHLLRQSSGDARRLLNALEIAAAGNTEVMRSKLRTMKQLNLDDRIEDLLITLGKQYHILRPCSRQEGMFFYFVLDKARSNLALARRKVTDIDRDLQF